MADKHYISQITLPTGTTYDLKDTEARIALENLSATVAGGVQYVGKTTSKLTDGATTNPVVVVNGDSSADYTAKIGDMVDYNNVLFLYNKKNQWDQLGSAGPIKALAYKDTAETNYTPIGTVSTPKFTGKPVVLTTKIVPAGTVTVTTAAATGAGNYTPSGTISAPKFTGTAGAVTVSGVSAGTVTIAEGTGTANYTPKGTVSVTPNVTLNTTTVNSITSVGTLPNFSTSVSGETLTLGWSAGTLPTKGANTTVATGVNKATATGTFTGTATQLTATYKGQSTSSTGTFTPSGSVDAPVFNGTATDITATFTGKEGSGSVNYTPEGTNSTPTFAGHTSTITVK